MHVQIFCLCNYSESHIDCGAHIYIMSDRKADKLIIKDLNLDHDHEEKSPSVQRERRRKRFSYAHMSRPAPEIEKPKKKPKLSSAVKQHKETAAKNCSVVVNVNGNKTNEKEILVEKHKKMMNLCMELWETSIECSDEEFSERFMFLKSILSWWKCGARPASYSNMGNDVNGSLFIKENTDVTNGELDAHLIVEATAEECLL